MVVIFRYLVKGKPTERFWNFISPEKHDAKTLTDCLLKEIEKLGINKDKLIAQTYDGANVMRGSSCGVQALLRETYSNAQYIHCHAHQLNLVMKNATSVNTNVRKFFAHLQAICVFFSTSPKRTEVLNNVMKDRKRLPRANTLRWVYLSRSVETVFDNKEEIKECFQRIENDDDFQDENTISFAGAYIKILENNNFNFWLTFFHKIMLRADILYRKLQNRSIDPSSIKICIETFETEIRNIREKFNFQESANNVSKRTKTDNSELNREGKEICDTIICQIKERFKFTGHLIAATLFVPENFAYYDTNFPEKNLTETCKLYPFLNMKKLQTELTLVYSTKEFRKMSGAVAFLDFIRENNLEITFSECVKILKVLITIPMTTSEAERCFSTLKRIKTFVRNTMSQERLSALAMLSVEKDFINYFISDFNKKVIEKFAHSKERRKDFLFK